MSEYALANSSLSRHLGGEKVASSPRIREWRQGKLKKPRPDTCFRIGEGLRSAGIPWSNGAFALIIAGYLDEFVGLLIWLSKSSIESDFLGMVLFIVCATLTLPANNAAERIDLLDEARERSASLFNHYGEVVLAAWRNVTRSARAQRRFVDRTNASLEVALFLAQHLPADDDLREIKVYDALIAWIRPRELLNPGFGTFAKDFLDALRANSLECVVDHHHKKRSRSADEYFKTWQRMWPHLMNEMEDDSLWPIAD